MSVFLLELSGQFQELENPSRGLIKINQAKIFSYVRFLKQIETIKKKKSITEVIVDYKTDFSTRTFSPLFAIRESLLELKQYGKKVIFYAREYSAREFYLAAVCDERLVNRAGVLLYTGFSSSPLFYKNLLENQEVELAVFRRGKYKSAGDSYRCEKYDEFNKEQYLRFLEVNAEKMKQCFQSEYNLFQDKIDKLLSGHVLTPLEAKNWGLITSIETAYERLSSYKKKDRVKKLKPKNKIGSGKKIAYLVFEGAIVDGKSGNNLLMGQTVGSDTFVKSVEKIKNNKSIKAVIFRVNSPGGSATASEDIRQAMISLSKEKPVIVSMSDVAGSGGYWVSCLNRPIIMDAGGITGSIGVIVMHLYLKKFWEKYNIKTDTIKTAPLADYSASSTKMSEEQSKIYESFVDSIYSEFLTISAETRTKTVADLDKLAQGRIWIAEDAVENGLIDKVGSYQLAVDMLKEELGSEKVELDFYPKPQRSLLEQILAKGAAAEIDIEKIASFKGSLALDPQLIQKNLI